MEPQGRDALLVAVVITAALVALFGQEAWRAWPPEKPVELFSAVGTCMAALVALWLGLRDVLIRRTETEYRTRIAAARVMHSLLELRGRVSMCRNTLEPFMAGKLPADRALDIAKDLDQVDQLASIDVMELRHLSDHSAPRLALSLTRLDSLRRDAREVGKAHPYGGLELRLLPEEKRRIWHRILSDAEDELLAVWVQCKRATEK